jgi:hypothetical protein
MHIFDWFADPPPTLEGFALTVATALWAFFRFVLDIRQFQDHNRHDELLQDWLSSSISYKKLVSLSIPHIPTVFVTVSLCQCECVNIVIKGKAVATRCFGVLKT